MATILVADDHPDLRGMLKIQLGKHGFACAEATNGREVIETLKSSPIDLVLMDLNMPELDGWQATSAIRASETLADIPIIALTAYSLVGDRARALAAGCNAFHCKPFDFELLLADIVRLLDSEKRNESPLAR